MACALSCVEMAKRGLTDEEIARELSREFDESDADFSEDEDLNDSDDDVDFIVEEVSESSGKECR